MKLIIKNDIGNENYQKNPNIKIINTDSTSFDNLVYYIEKNDIPVIKFTDENSFYMINSLHERYIYSNSEVYIKVSKSELENIGTGNIQIDYNDLDNLPTLVTNHSDLNLDDGANPHGTTKDDVGLGNVDNTSDVDKPISTATQNALNLKLDKVSTSGVERAYIVNADGSQSTKATSEIGTTQNYFTFSTNTTLSNAHHNAVIWVTATINITIPSGLRSDFNCTFRTLTGAIATFLTSGTTINAESDGDVQSAKTMSFLAQYTTNNYIISGGGLS